MIKKGLLLILLVNVLIISSSCSGNKLEGTKPPIPTVEVDTINIPVVRGGYCWYECVDAPSIQKIVELKEATVVPKDTDITITFDFEPNPSNISVTRMKKNEEEHYNQPLKTPSGSGIYYYNLDARWDYNNIEADSSYAFVIKIQ